MKPLSILPVLLSAIIISGCSCKKEPPLPSPAIGNKFSCKVNGQDWIATDIQGGFYYSSIENKYWVYIYASKGNESIDIYFNPPFQTGIKQLNKNTQTWFYAVSPKDYGNFAKSINGYRSDWITDSLHIGSINVLSIDDIGKTLKCSFSFTAFNSQTNDVINITNGYLEKSN